MASNGKRSPLVLCYHAVSDDWKHSLSVSPATFERQVTRLASFYTPLTAEEVLLNGRRGMHITFDDAFCSIASVLPTLQRLQVPATVFACTRNADDGGPLLVPTLAREAESFPAELATMSWSELRAIAEDGVEVGSHTVTHPRLTQLSPAELERELVESRERIEDELGRPCRFLAYPYGDEAEHVRAAAEAAGYSAAFAMSTDLTRADPFAIPRVGIWRMDHALRAAAKILIQHARKRPVWPTKSVH